MFLTEEKFLSYFPQVNITIDEFVDKVIVTYRDNPTLRQLFDLHSVIKTTDDVRYIKRDQIVNYLYDLVITHRFQYLKEFYHNYFQIPNPYELKWDNVNILTHKSQQIVTTSEQFNDMLTSDLPCISLQKNDQSRKIVRNLNYLDILHNTNVSNTCKSKTSFWQTFDNLYNHLKLEDRFFAKSSLELFLRPKPQGGINYNNFFYLVQQYQPKASILNPYTMNWIIKNLFSGTKLFTPVLSWTSYMCAFLHSDWEHYVGVDVMNDVCERCKYLFNYYQQQLKPSLKNKREIDRLNKKTIDIYCCPSESLLNNQQFLSRYSNYFDGVIMCPPYYNMEIYPNGEQSTKLYPNYQDWLIKYWENTVILSHMLLMTGKRFGFIINNYDSLKKESYPLIHDLNIIALKYFKLIGSYRLLNRVSPLRMNKKNRTEMLFIYEKQ